MLSGKDLRERMVPPLAREKEEKYWNLFRQRRWEELADLREPEFPAAEKVCYDRRILLHPYEPLRVTPFSYDLGIGECLYSLQTPERGIVTLEEAPYEVVPGEAIVLLSQEVVALPPAYAATVWPRFRMVRDGIFQSMVKIDPTWYGKLAVALTNLSPAVVPLKKGQRFGTLVVYELSSESDVNLWKRDDLPEVEVAWDRLKAAIGQGKEEVTGRRLEEAKARLQAEEAKPLQPFCRVEGKAVFVKDMDADRAEELRALASYDWWNEFVDCLAKRWQCAEHPDVGKRMIAMDALGMSGLSEILKGAQQQQGRVQPEELEAARGVGEDLRDIAVRYGRPFDVIAKLPARILDSVETEVGPRLEATIHSGVLTLVLRLVGTLSLVVGLIALLIKLQTTQDTRAELFFGWGVYGFGAAVFVAVLVVPWFVGRQRRRTGSQEDGKG